MKSTTDLTSPKKPLPFCCSRWTWRGVLTAATFSNHTCYNFPIQVFIWQIIELLFCADTELTLGSEHTSSELDPAPALLQLNHNRIFLIARNRNPLSEAKEGNLFYRHLGISYMPRAASRAGCCRDWSQALDSFPDPGNFSLPSSLSSSLGLHVSHHCSPFPLFLSLSTIFSTY